MESLEALLSGLEARHRAALEWYRSRSGATVAWPGSLPDGTRLVSKGKAIYKPEGSRHALSIRQNWGSPYPDREPNRRPDGSWRYEYAPEDESRGAVFTNAALVANMLDRVPVAVMRQVQEGPTMYRVEGLAMVEQRTPQHFILEGFSSAGQAPTPPASQAEERLQVVPAPDFDATDLQDARSKQLKAIRERRGQAKFRRQLIDAYGGACAVTGCVDVNVLEAAHILPYRGDKTHHVQNGLLLRADIHTLLDLGMVAIEPQTLIVRVSPSLASPEYRALDGARLRRPLSARSLPNPQALATRWAEATAQWKGQRVSEHA